MTLRVRLSLLSLLALAACSSTTTATDAASADASTDATSDAPVDRSPHFDVLGETHPVDVFIDRATDDAQFTDTAVDERPAVDVTSDAAPDVTADARVDVSVDVTPDVSVDVAPRCGALGDPCCVDRTPACDGALLCQAGRCQFRKTQVAMGIGEHGFKSSWGHAAALEGAGSPGFRPPTSWPAFSNPIGESSV